MAIENVMMMNVVGKINYVDRFAKDIFLFNDIQIVDAMNEIDTGRFTLPVCEENIGELLGFAQLVPGENMVDEKIFVQKVQKLNELYDNKLTLDTKALSKKEYDLGEILEKADRFQNYLDTEFENLGKAREELKRVNTSIEAYEYIKNIDVKMEDLNNMEYFTYTIGSVSKDNAARLKSIYNTVTSIVFHVGDTSQNEEVFMIISPKDFEVETNRILKALNFKLVEGYDDAYIKAPGDILADLGLEKVKLEKIISENETLLEKHRNENKVEAEEVFNVLTLYANLNIIKKYMAFSEENFYFSGWVSKKDRAALEKIAAQYDNMIVMFTDPDAANKPPTKMKNNWVFRPFETLVKMYGVPAYNELDPTPFLSITYLFCFGYMFGDVGQGLVLLLAGYIFGKRGVELGHVIARMACSSIIFGFIYGSIFGNESILPTLWVRPFENINTVLLTAVVLGVVMLFVAYLYSIINKLRAGDIKEGLFGKNGIAGFVLYISILLCALCATGIIPGGSAFTPFLAVLAVALVILVLLREPIANTIRKRKLYDTSAGDYYVESGFELFEMLLAMLSNTLSFIRVGAFALTHVGLFMAFETLATMVGGGFGGVIVLIIGNVLIIVLEGLIDFIQCLRLQFYELFSKYYTGDGEEFVPLSSEIRNTL
ncbi:V-type ATP synthase subunit I [Eubacterium maltosivorans]|uniref:ATPase n=1 Tax=Eubacterium maltosivorans TaxID=2041044 RepID=A0A4V1GLQ5_EUBML|nr:V-type ATPase 116kDa subunit family protein [Eubacterium maltosivorans]QCT70606.1 ATPase [Eubacterium maltosivorans]